MAALAANEHTNPVLLKHLQEQEPEVDESEIDWITPQSDEEVAELMGVFGSAIQAARRP